MSDSLLKAFEQEDAGREEIWRQTGGRVDALVHAVSTTHSIHGIGRALRREKPGLRVVAVEPSESAVLSGGPPGSHRIEGIGIGFVPPLWRREEGSEILAVSTDEAKAMARRLAREEAIFAGAATSLPAVQPSGSANRYSPGSCFFRKEHTREG